MRKIALTKGKVALIDNKDILNISKYSWNFTNGYAYTKINNKSISMSRFLLNPPKNLWVDHINGNKLDNRRNNLRIVNPSQNSFNRLKNSSNRSGYKGVYLATNKKQWQAEIRANGKRQYLGKYSTKEEAAMAYNEAARRMHGKYAKLEKVEIIVFSSS